MVEEQDSEAGQAGKPRQAAMTELVVASCQPPQIATDSSKALWQLLQAVVAGIQHPHRRKPGSGVSVGSSCRPESRTETMPVLAQTFARSCSQDMAKVLAGHELKYKPVEW